MKSVAFNASEEGWYSQRAGECVLFGEKGLDIAKWLPRETLTWECTSLRKYSEWIMADDQDRRGLKDASMHGRQWPRTRFTLWYLILLPQEYKCSTHLGNKWGGPPWFGEIMFLPPKGNAAWDTNKDQPQNHPENLISGSPNLQTEILTFGMEGCSSARTLISYVLH